MNQENEPRMGENKITAVWQFWESGSLPQQVWNELRPEENTPLEWHLRRCPPRRDGKCAPEFALYAVGPLGAPAFLQIDVGCQGRQDYVTVY